MTTDGGNWKELVGAASKPGGGDLTVVHYHLDRGIDPNYQHPEFMTTPLLEAIRAGNHEAAKVLLEHKPNQADPTLEGSWEGQTPMELSLELKDHTMVDTLLTYLPKDYDNECKTVVVTGTCHRDILAHFLDLGHSVIVLTEQEELSHEEETMAETLRLETGNTKLWYHPSANLSELLDSSNKTTACWNPSKVDVWLHKINKPDNLIDDFVSQYPKVKGAAKILLLLESGAFAKPATQQQLSWLLSTISPKDSTIFALVEPATWWDTMTYSFWYNTWCASIARLLGLVQASLVDPHVVNDYGVHGKAYTYKRQNIVLPDAEKISDSDSMGWAKQLETIQP
ncbi:ANK [Seminavis robusta]|uniref:ANK n=1 Tax=Seminavis robusta TaxID=568900 RepID=A0A9N8HP02_9STRA|nr:ANK [Seminavis robusta]|eukprot:Sro1026_g232960.1 ANK (340) ;mRNA; f:34268-35287